MTVNNTTTHVNAVIQTVAGQTPQFNVANFNELAAMLGSSGGVSYDEYTWGLTVPANTGNEILICAARETRESLVIHNTSSTETTLVFLVGDANSQTYFKISPMGTLTLNRYTFPWKGNVYARSNSASPVYMVMGEIYISP